MSHLWDSNPRPAIYETAALPAELRWLMRRVKIKNSPSIDEEFIQGGQIF